MFDLKLIEIPMPTGSRDPEVLLDWILESMGLLRRRASSSEELTQTGTLHRIMNNAFLVDPLKGWNSHELSDATGMSKTGIHHQLIKLRKCGLVSPHIEGKWHRNTLRGGSMFAATSIVQAEAISILKLRLSELVEMVEHSETRMKYELIEVEQPFSIRITEPGPRRDGVGRNLQLASDFGFCGDSSRSKDPLASDLLEVLSKSQHPLTLLALSERLSESRGRVITAVERIRSAGVIQKVPMIDRIPQDVFASITRQYDARGGDWLMTRGGLGRLPQTVSEELLEGVNKNNLGIEKVREILEPVPIPDQSILLNTLGGRIPHGIRLAGVDGSAIYNRVIRMAERTLRRITSVAKRLDEEKTNL